MGVEFFPFLITILLLFLLTVFCFLFLWSLLKKNRKLELRVAQFKEELEQESKQRILQSRAVLMGQISEHFAPLMQNFPANSPKDCKFLGQPVDYIVFDGLESGGPVYIRFVEVKTGGSKLNAHEQSIRKAIQEGRVSFDVFRPMINFNPSGGVL